MSQHLLELQTHVWPKKDSRPLHWPLATLWVVCIDAVSQWQSSESLCSVTLFKSSGAMTMWTLQYTACFGHDNRASVVLSLHHVLLRTTLCKGCLMLKICSIVYIELLHAGSAGDPCMISSPIGTPSGWPFREERNPSHAIFPSPPFQTRPSIDWQLKVHRMHILRPICNRYYTEL